MFSNLHRKNDRIHEALVFKIRCKVKYGPLMAGIHVCPNGKTLSLTQKDQPFLTADVLTCAHLYIYHDFCFKIRLKKPSDGRKFILPSQSFLFTALFSS